MGPPGGKEKVTTGMYTQCPECATAFRVTAEILKQAAGRVRCGGCGNPFNALDYLSEQKPAARARPATGGAGKVPELRPEKPELHAGQPPETISAERSAALLKTLDELAGSDIRIEDTGVEWRVLGSDEEQDDDAAATEIGIDGQPDDSGSWRWFVDESPTPVDEQLSAEPGNVDAPEIFEPADPASSSAVMRFDDDTPLPEDFDFDQEPEVTAPEAAIDVREAPADLEAAQVDLELGEPEDWEDLLQEVATPTAAGKRDDDAGRETADSGDAAPLPDVDEQFATQAEAMGIDLSGIHSRAGQPRDADEDDTTIDDDLIAAAFKAEARAGRTADGDTGRDADIELTGATEFELADDTEIDFADESLEENEIELADEPVTASGIELTIDTDDDEETAAFDFEFDYADLVEVRDRELVGRSPTDARLAAELGLDGSAAAAADGDETGAPDEDERPEHYVPPPTEEEMTVNMMIDQDLLAIAVEDEDGFASTIVQKQRSGLRPAARYDIRDDAADGVSAEPGAEDARIVETIIMEGESIHAPEDEEKLEAARREAAAMASAAKAGEPAPKPPLDYRLVAGIAGLAVLLGLQVLHQYRESLAVYPAFNQSIGAVYRMLGRPVTPSWDITGWRFEATKGSTDEDDKVLTIYSRIGNKSAESLPYPLINVSLTDRFEDIIGSKVLEPGDYLAENLDTRVPVAPGNTFSALISIDAPDAAATGFKLNVCYRQPGGRLKCAIDDFK